MTIQELYTKRATAWEAAKQFLDIHRMENGMLSSEDGEVYDRMEKEIENLTTEIERMKRLDSIGKDLEKPVNKPLTSKPMASEPVEEKKGRFSHQYAVDFLAAMRTNFRQVTDVLQEGIEESGG